MNPGLPLASVDPGAAADTVLAMDAYAIHAGHVDDVAAIADIAGVAPEVVERMLADPRGLAKLNAAATKAEAEGKTLAPYARHLRLQLLHAVKATIDKGIDGFEAVELDKLIERIVVQDERVKMAQKDPYANLPVINVQIIHGSIKAELVKPGTPMADVVDVVVSEPEGGL